jgi:uncharacterized protein YecT (DUF1311 family)
MKKVLICSVAALAILLAGGTALTQETDRAKEAPKEASKEVKKAAEKKLSEQDKQFKEKFKEMTPEQKRLALMQRALDDELAPWLAVRKIAVEESATKTVAAIDKIIAAKKEQFKKRSGAMKEDKPAQGEKSKTEAKRPEAQRSDVKKKPETQQ